MIDATRVHEILLDCLYRNEEIENGLPFEAVKAEAIMRTFAFHPERLEEHRKEIISILTNLPPQFRREEGGGWSFLSWCFYPGEHGELIQWGEHPTGEELIALGAALGFVKYVLPREMWEVLPGGVPYLVLELPKETYGLLHQPG